jgi:TetR/AcrR family transcriptional regulator, transcriptional repressor of aconitase
MPKVSEEHLEARKQQIVTAAFACFARKGFHPTTMQDICAQAELSAGAVYRYFPSKESIIASACNVSQDTSDQDLLAGALAVPDTSEMLRGLADAFFSRLDGEDAVVQNRAILQLWAEVAVNADVRDAFREHSDVIGDGMRAIVVEAQRRGDFASDLDPDSIERAMFALYDGFRLQKAITPDLPTAPYVAVVTALLTGQFWAGSAPDPVRE